MGVILQSRTVCLYKCRDKVQPLLKEHHQGLNSCYVRLIRFFKMEHIEDFLFGVRITMWSLVELDLTYLIMDRSNWKRGAKNINLLTIGSLVHQVFIPFNWVQLNRDGNSNLADRKTLIEGLINLLQTAGKTVQGSILLADREFIGQQWFEFLLSHQLSFVIRLKEKMYFELKTITGTRKTSLRYFHKYIERYGIYSIPMSLAGITYTFVMIKNPKYDPREPYIYFISDLKDAPAIANHYLKRWKIECCFKNLKSNGFNVEDINLKSDKKIELMMGILTLIYLIAIREGLIRHRLKPIPVKKYKNGKTYLSLSVFRSGLAAIQCSFNGIYPLMTYIEDNIKLSNHLNLNLIVSKIV